MSWPSLESLITTSAEPPRWLIQDFLHSQSLVCLAGVPGVGKSTLAYALAVAVASGRPFLGLVTSPGRVLYLDEENSASSQPTYFRWAWRGLDSPPLEQLAANLRVGQNAILSHNGPWTELMLAEARAFRPALIICDTSSSCFRVHDENDNAEAGKVIASLKLIQAAADNLTTILILRHARVEHDPSGREAPRYRMRGASAWAGATDGIIFHLAGRGRPRGLRPTHLIPDKTRAFGLREQLNITPSWTSDDETTRGLKFAGHFSVGE